MDLIFFFFLLLAIFLCSVYFVLRAKVSLFFSKYFGTSDIKKVIEITEFENENTPKSLAGMETIALPLIGKDFPELNVDELKGLAEKSIIDYLEMLEKKQINNISFASDKVMSFIKSRVEDIKSGETIHFDSIKIHRTVLNKYEKKSGIATIIFVTGLEYRYKKGNESYKKIQDRFKTSFIYIIDKDKVSNYAKAIGLNCPNCGAPIKNIGHKSCDYCGAGVVDIVKKTWILNDISQY